MVHHLEIKIISNEAIQCSLSVRIIPKSFVIIPTKNISFILLAMEPLRLSQEMNYLKYEDLILIGCFMIGLV